MIDKVANGSNNAERLSHQAGDRPMIVSISLRDFKAHKSLELTNLPKVAVIVGPNNIGKSTLLHAMAIPRYGLSQRPELPIGTSREIPRAGTSEARVKIQYAGNPSPPPLEIVVSSQSQFNQPNIILAPSGFHPFRRGPGERPAEMGLFFNQPVPGLARYIVNDYVSFISAARGLPGSFNYSPLDDEVGPIGENTGNILQNLISSRDGRFDAIEGWARQLGCDITSIASETIASNQGITTYTVRDVRTKSTFVGSGTLSAIPIVVQGVLSHPGQTMLVEEPESHLHRGAMNGLWKFFQDCANRNVQVICTSHSFDFLEALYRRVMAQQVESEHVRIYALTRGQTGDTSVETITPEQVSDYKDRIARKLADD